MNQKSEYDMRTPIRIFPVVVGLFLFIHAAAQENIKKEVVVVKPYEPTLSDAFKINTMPAINDTLRTVPSFEYGITPKKHFSEVQSLPIPAAKLGPEAIDKLYKSYLQMGMGNYTTPLFGLNISSTRSSKYLLGLSADHLSSHGKIKLENDEKVFAGFGDNKASLYGHSWKNNVMLSGELGFRAHTVYHYGYNPSVDTVLDKEDIQHSLLSLRPTFTIQSMEDDSNRLNYNIGGYYLFNRLHTSAMENGFGIRGEFSKLYENNWLGAETEFRYLQPTESIDTSYNALFSFAPWFNRHSDEWTFQLGFAMEADIRGGETEFHVYPRAHLEFHVIPSRLIAYFHAGGRTIMNDQLTAFDQNPFLHPELKLRNTNQKINVLGGLRGNIGDVGLNAGVSYSIYDDMPFFLPDSVGFAGNYFTAVYDQVDETKIFAELGYQYNRKLDFALRANYYQYQLSDLLEAYHKPVFDGSFSAIYNLQDKIISKMEIYFAGKRTAVADVRDALDANAQLELKGYADVNIGVEYRYTKVLSAFVRFNNMAASKYKLWVNYPVQSFQFMAGFTYAL